MPKKNAYYFFMVEYRKNSNKNLTLEEASEAASDSWKAMTDDQRSKYKKMALEAPYEPHYRQKPKIPACCKPKTSQQLLEQELKLSKIFLMKSQVRQWLTNKGTNISNMAITVIHFNMFCEDLPAEVALIKFSIDNGVMTEMNEQICVKKLPLGTSYEATKQQMETHGLPLPPKAIGEENYGLLREKIVKFVEDKTIFCHPDVHVDVKGGLKFLGIQDEIILCDYVELLHQIVLIGNPDHSWTYKNWLNYVDLDPFDSSAKACKLHEFLDRSQFCSLSIVKRLAFRLMPSNI